MIPTLFNLLIANVMLAMCAVLATYHSCTGTAPPLFPITIYADDSLLLASSPHQILYAHSYLTANLGHFGLRLTFEKSEYMVFDPHNPFCTASLYLHTRGQLLLSCNGMWHL